MNEGRCDERLKVRVEESTCLTYTGLHDKTNWKYQKIKMRSKKSSAIKCSVEYFFFFSFSFFSHLFKKWQKS
jgi:hypothetical protein